MDSDKTDDAIKSVFRDAIVDTKTYEETTKDREMRHNSERDLRRNVKIVKNITYLYNLKIELDTKIISVGLNQGGDTHTKVRLN